MYLLEIKKGLGKSVLVKEKSVFAPRAAAEPL